MGRVGGIPLASPYCPAEIPRRAYGALAIDTIARCKTDFREIHIAEYDEMIIYYDSAMCK